MPNGTHDEQHFTATALVRDLVIGMADGLTVPFALAAGLAGAVEGTRIVVTAGLAEIAAGSIAMGLGGFLAARTEVHHYDSEYRREERETIEIPDEERREVAEILHRHGLREPELAPVVRSITSDRHRWVNFMMRFELGLERPDPRRAPVSAATIGSAYVVGGLLPLLPYMLLDDLRTALLLSVPITLLALFVFGGIKGYYTGLRPIPAGLQTTLVGGLAAAAAYGIARLVGG